MTTLYQYQLLDLDMDTLLGNNLVYDLPARFELEETNPLISAAELKQCDFQFDEKEEIEFVIKVVTNAVNKEEEFAEEIGKLLVKWDYDRLGLVERSILLMAFSEMDLHTADRKTIIDESVELAKVYCEDDAYAMINGVLDHHE
ncbi:MAG: transcription antitermination protein NusB [Erysipelotrichales bacterium]|nr:transcription antitermination protein NusB [Erysipelotrichales bacterium]